MLKIAMLKYHFRSANRDTFAAVGAFVLKHYVSAVATSDYGVFRTGFQAFAALSANPGLILTRLRESGFYS
jgi:hypothetical protein